MIMGKRNKNERSGAPKESWVKLPREITTSSELNPYQFRMLALLMDRENYFNTSWFWCSMGWLVAHTGMKRTKAKETLQELEEMGFINITSHKDTRKPNHFHINRRFINTYHGPKTQEELEEMNALEELEGLDVQEQTCEPPVSKTSSAAAPATYPKSSWTQYLTPLEKSLNSPYKLRRHSPEDLKEMGMPFTLPENNHYPPAKEWYCASNRQYVRDTYFPTLLEMEQSYEDVSEHLDELYHYVYAEVLHWVLPCVKESEDAVYVWQEVIKPDFEEYKKEQISDGQGL